MDSLSSSADETNGSKAKVIGICGVTCSGKTTIASRLESYLNEEANHQAGDSSEPRSEKPSPGGEVEACRLFESDVYYWPEESGYWKNDGTDNWDELASVDWNSLISDLKSCLHKYRLIIIDGIMIFDHIELDKMFDRRFYFTLDKETVEERRKARDYIPLEPPGKTLNSFPAVFEASNWLMDLVVSRRYFEAIAWPFYLNQLPQMAMRSDIVKLDARRTLDEIFEEIVDHLPLEHACNGITTTVD